jgi:hypothetical protein
MLRSKSLPHAVDTEVIRSLSVMATTAIKKKDDVIIAFENLIVFL